jgi:glycosyltransferase involved in cell wall biosynthesis
VADYATELLPELARRASVRVLLPPGGEAQATASRLGLEVVPADAPLLPGELQLISLGNNPHHEWLLPRLSLPGTVVVAHDLVFHHLLVEATLARGDREGYEKGLAEAHGDAGSGLARARRHGFTGRRDPFLFPARRAFLTGVAAVVVHSAWARRQLERELPDLRVIEVGLAVADPGPVDRAAVRQRLGLPAESAVIMHLGFLTPQKGMTELLTALAATVGAGVDVRLVLVGEGSLDGRLERALRELGLGDRVVSTGWVDATILPGLPAGADLGVVLRTPSAGETSAAAVRFLACGTPVAVGGSEQSLEWPPEAAPRLTPGPAATAELARLMTRVAAGRTGDEWRHRRAAARGAYEVRHRPGDVAELLVGSLEALRQGS